MDSFSRPCNNSFTSRPHRPRVSNFITHMILNHRQIYKQCQTRKAIRNEINSYVDIEVLLLLLQYPLDIVINVSRQKKWDRDTKNVIATSMVVLHEMAPVNLGVLNQMFLKTRSRVRKRNWFGSEDLCSKRCERDFYFSH